MKKGLFIVAIFIILIFTLFFVFWKGQKGSKQVTGKVITNVSTLPKEVTIVLDKNGFNPKEVTIKVGSAVVWKNVSGDKQTVNSDDYPTNQLHKELNFGIFANNSSVSYVFRVPGTYGYHNQFHPQQNGRIVVEN